jgi:hypothetical protein
MRLEGPDGPVEHTKGMIALAMSYYNNLFDFEEKLDIILVDDFWHDNEKVSDPQNEMLNADFTEQEVKDAIFGSYAEGAPGPDGLPFLFYQHFWELVKGDLLLLINDWNKGELDHLRLKFSLLTLIPKEDDAITIQKFRPIALTNCSFKIFSKCATNRLGLVSEELISQNQTTFIKGRYILESVVSAHEIIHDVAHSSQSSFIFKLDYEKAYDEVNREFMFKMLESRGFSPIWIRILKSLLDNGSVVVRTNDENSDFFLTEKE